MENSLERLRELQEQMMAVREEADRLIAESHRILGSAKAEKQAKGPKANPSTAKRNKAR